MSRSKRPRYKARLICGGCYFVGCRCKNTRVSDVAATLDDPYVIAFEAAELDPYDYDEDWCPYCDRPIFVGLGTHLSHCVRFMAEGGFSVQPDPTEPDPTDKGKVDT